MASSRLHTASTQGTGYGQGGAVASKPMEVPGNTGVVEEQDVAKNEAAKVAKSEPAGTDTSAAPQFLLGACIRQGGERVWKVEAEEEH